MLTRVQNPNDENSLAWFESCAVYDGSQCYMTRSKRKSICLRTVRFTRILKLAITRNSSSLSLRAMRFTRVLKRVRTPAAPGFRLRAMWFMRAPEQLSGCVIYPQSLRAVRFAGGSNQELFRRCLRIAWFTRVFNYSKSARCAASCLRAVWFTRGLNQKGVRWSIF